MCTKEKHSRWNGGPVARNCEICGTGFSVKLSAVNRGGGRFCGRACLGVHNTALRLAKRVKKECLICGNSINVKPSHSMTEGTYCSRTCMAKGYTATLTGTSNPNYKNGGSRNMADALRTRRKRISANGGSHTQAEWNALCLKHGNRCLCCGEQKPLTKDHVVPVTKGGTDDITNLQPLCRRCNSHKHTEIKDYR